LKNKIEKFCRLGHEMLIEPEMKAAPCGDFLLRLQTGASGRLAHRANDL
jgi:hypothetical protein